MNKKILILFLTTIMCLSGCGKSNQNQETPSTEIETPIIIAQNDYAGAFQRLNQIQTDVINTMSLLETYNYDVQKGNPTDYWSEQYFFVEFLPVYSSVMEETKIINEIDDFSTIQNYLQEQYENLGHTKISITKEEAHHYIIKYDDYFMNRETLKRQYGTRTMEIIYDASSNRFRVESKIRFNSKGEYEPDFFYEFAQLEKGVYAIQNDTERMYVKYNDDGTLKTFNYTVLGKSEIEKAEEILSFLDYKAFKSDYGEGILYKIPNADNQYVSFYEGAQVMYFSIDKNINTITLLEQADDYILNRSAVKGYYDKDNDSIYTRLSNINEAWVTESDYFKKHIIYNNTGEEQTLSVQTINPLTKEKEEFELIANISEEDIIVRSEISSEIKIENIINESEEATIE